MKNYCECFSGPHAHIRTRTLACLMNWLDGGARAPDMSKGKGNHCKSHSVTCASFWKKKYPGFFVAPLVPSALRLWPDSAPHTSSISSPESPFSSLIHPRIFIPLHSPTKARLLLLFHPPTSKISETPARVCARLERRSGDEDRFPAYLSDLDWNSVRVR